MNRPSPDDMNDIIMAEQRAKIKELEEENKDLKNKLEEVAKELIQHHEEYKNMADMVVELQKENKNLKLIIEDNEKQMRLYMEDRDNLREENKELKEKLEHYEIIKAIQESNDASRWKPGCMSYVDRELNHF